MTNSGELSSLHDLAREGQHTPNCVTGGAVNIHGTERGTYNL